MYHNSNRYHIVILQNLKDKLRQWKEDYITEEIITQIPYLLWFTQWQFNAYHNCSFSDRCLLKSHSYCIYCVYVQGISFILGLYMYKSTLRNIMKKRLMHHLLNSEKYTLNRKVFHLPTMYILATTNVTEANFIIIKIRWEDTFPNK